MKFRSGFLVLGACLVLAACPGRDDTARVAPIDFTVAQDEVERVRSDYAAAFNAGDADRIAELFVSDGTMSIPNEQPVRGRDAVRQVVARDAGMFGSLQLLPEETRVTAEWAYDSGRATQAWRAERPAGAPERLESTYAALLLREADGQWRIRRLVVSNDVPITADQAPGAKPGPPGAKPGTAPGTKPGAPGAKPGT